ncbi:MAG: alpha/beta fold hydrolase [Burkholderiaceae bacterium]
MSLSPDALRSASVAAGPIHADEYWADKSGVRLWVYRKYLGPPDVVRPLLFLVHGSSYSGKTMFDLQVPGRSGYSMMDHCAGLGYEVWTMDHEGYGRSDRTASTSDIASGVDDLKAAMAVLERVTGRTSAAFFGQSSGALRAARFANVYPQHVDRLALDAFVWTGEGAPTLIKRARMLPQLLASNVREVDADFYASVFTRDHAGAAEAMLGETVARAELEHGHTIPNGTYIDMVSKLPLVDPERLHCPVLIMRAEHDGIATEADLLAFYARLPHADKQIVKMGGLAHTALLGVNRRRLYHVLQAFLTLPACIAIDAGGHAGTGEIPRSER